MFSLTILTVLAMAEGCAAPDEEVEAEIGELSQGLESDGGSSFDAGSTGGGAIEAGTVGGLGGLGGFAGLGGLDGSVPPPPLDGGGFISGTGGLAGLGGLFGGDGGFPGGPVGPVPFANWKFDDCGPSTSLLDSSPSHVNAVRSAQVSCAPGLVAGAVLIDAKKDTIVAPASALFDATNRVAMTAWINPTNVQQGSLIKKSLNGTTAFELLLKNGNLVFHINIDNGRKVKEITSKAPIQADRWTHVAALYDGSFVRLFEDAVQVGQVAATGVIADVRGPIEIGNNQANEFVRGRIDEVWLSRDVVTQTDLQNFACIRGQPTMAISPATSGPQDLGSTFSYDIAIVNNDVGACTPRNPFLSAFAQDSGFTTSILPNNLSVPAASTGHASLQVTSSFDAEPGGHQIQASAIFFDDSFFVLDASAEYVAKEPTGCFVRTGRELMIRDLSVVEDPLRTTFAGPAEDARTGAWTFGRLMEQLAPTDAEAPDMVEQMFNTWLTDQTINGFSVPAKPSMRDLVLNTWPRSANGKLDLTRAPLRLLAIVNRIDSRNLAQGHAGEGRFVFGVLDPSGFATEFTVIFEFRLPAQTTADVLDWANRWHALGALPFPSEQYNAGLQALTDRFSRRGAEPGRPNGSALAQLRTNEIALTNSRWELREFELSASTHRLEPVTVKLTPDTGFIQGSPLVADFVNQNEASVLLEQHTVPALFEGQRFLGGSSFNDLFAWTAPGIDNNEARHKFSLNTCNGCHSLEENGTAFLHVFPRGVGQVSQLSGFLQGISVADPITGIPRQFNDLGRRNTDLKQLVCPAPAPTARTASPSASREAFIAKGIDRTH